MKELTAKTWDMIITVHPFTHELIEYVPLFEDHLSVKMDPKHPLSEKHFLTAKDFEKENFISLSAGPDPEEILYGVKVLEMISLLLPMPP